MLKRCVFAAALACSALCFGQPLLPKDILSGAAYPFNANDLHAQGTITLKEGSYVARIFSNGAEAAMEVSLVEKDGIAEGDIDNDGLPDYAALLRVSIEGDGTYLYLSVLLGSELMNALVSGHAPLALEPHLLGPYMPVDMVSILPDRLILYYVDETRGSPLRPDRLAERSFALQPIKTNTVPGTEQSMLTLAENKK